MGQKILKIDENVVKMMKIVKKMLENMVDGLKIMKIFENFVKIVEFFNKTWRDVEMA